jgi:hypothetical protein
VQTGLASATQNIHNSSRSVVTPTEIVRDVLKYHIYHCSVLPPFIPQGSTDDLRSKTTSALCLSSYVECILPNPFLDAIRDGRERPRTNRLADSMFAPRHSAPIVSRDGPYWEEWRCGSQCIRYLLGDRPVLLSPDPPAFPSLYGFVL